MHNIALNSDGDGFDANGWIPIGNTSSEFTGTFNGNGHIISNLWINRPNDCYVGLFGWIKGGHIKNLGVKIADSGIIGKCNVGGIVGRITDLGKITTSYSKGSITGYNAGGIAGYINNGFVLYSYSEGSVIGTGSSVGGIVGRVNVGQISHSYSISNISGDQNVGGIAGYARQAVIINNAAINPSVTGYYDVNRVIGYSVKSLETSNNFALNTMTISDTVINDANGLDGASKEIGEFKLKTTYSNSIINGGLDWYFGDKNINIIGVGNKAWIMPSNSYPKLY
ncbi:MAG: hypothetical protein LBJ88_01335 [Campylobacteraceae bacterium]|nr:hypothetical protein [Campylobacteraceae bacterium]